MIPKNGPILAAPAGPSTRHWDNLCIGTTKRVLCEFCGTMHREQKDGEDGHTIATLLGRQIVGECCGGVVDALYQELGELFTLALLEDFAENPLDPRFNALRTALSKTLHKARDKGEGLVAQTTEQAAALAGD